MNKRRYLVVGGIVVAVGLLASLLYTVLANHGPVIASLQAEPQEVCPGRTCQIVCDATAPDGGELSYSWSASGGEIAGKGPAVMWTAPQSSGSYTVAVLVIDGHGGKATASGTITVNSLPTIVSLVSVNSTTPGTSVQLTCTAQDPDGDTLSYEWTADGGDISGSGTTVNWTAPQEVGAYNVTVVVKDGHGGEGARVKAIGVGLCAQPTIESLTVAPNGNRYLKPDGVPGCDYEVYQTKRYDIDCVACGMGEVAYAWSCHNGEISGEGQMVTWTAPSTPSSIKVTITVTVSDGTGKSVSEDIVFYVSYCTCPF
jgi:hypothetical protein